MFQQVILAAVIDGLVENERQVAASLFRRFFVIQMRDDKSLAVMVEMKRMNKFERLLQAGFL